MNQGPNTEKISFEWPKLQIPEYVKPKFFSGRSNQVSKIVLEAETSRFSGAISRCARQYPKLGFYLAGAAGLSVILAIARGTEASSAQREIEFRRSQLQKPTYDLKGEEAFNLPWNKENLNEWLYRPVAITGRPMHHKAILIPRVVNGYDGFDYIVPLVTKENEDGSIKEGVLLNKGWMYHEYANPGARWRIENALPQTFLGYVSLNSELDEKNSFFKRGNSFSASSEQKRSTWSHLYLPDAANESGLKNTDKVKLALIECVTPGGVLDEKLAKHFDVNLIGSEDYPFAKTKSGALQLRKMPWDLRGEQNTYVTAAALFGAAAGALKFLA